MCEWIGFIKVSSGRQSGNLGFFSTWLQLENVGRLPLNCTPWVDTNIRICAGLKRQIIEPCLFENGFQNLTWNQWFKEIHVKQMPFIKRELWRGTKQKSYHLSCNLLKIFAFSNFWWKVSRQMGYTVTKISHFWVECVTDTISNVGLTNIAMVTGCETWEEYPPYK